MFGGDRGTDEDVPVIEVFTLEQAAENGVVERFRQFGLLVLMQQPNVFDLHPLPQLFVQPCNVETFPKQRDGFSDPLIVEVDSLPRCVLHRHPLGVLESLPGACGNLLEQGEVSFESAQDCTCDILCQPPGHDYYLTSVDLRKRRSRRRHNTGTPPG
jgi:hypothetical protein